jgi:protein TonB
MEEIKQSIFFSALLHTILIATAFIFAGNSDIRKEKLIVVSLLEELAQPSPLLQKPHLEQRIDSYKELKSDTAVDPFALPNPPQIQKYIQPHSGTEKGIKIVSNEEYQNISTSVTIPESKLTKNTGKQITNQDTAKSQSGNTITKVVQDGSHKGDAISLYSRIRAAIEKVKIYPFLARKKRIEGTVITGFTITNKGYPQDIKIARSSGSEILDSAAVKIVIKAAPFPEVNGKIVVPITFKLTDSTLSSR